MELSDRRKGRARKLGLAALVTLALMAILSILPEVAESVYGNGLYPVIRSGLDPLALPWPGIFMMLGTLSLVLIILIWRLIFGVPSMVIRIIRFGKSMIGLLAVLLIWFYVAWGFNYCRPDIIDRMDMTTIEPDTAWLFDEIFRTISLANESRSRTSLEYLDGLSPDEILSTNFDVKKINDELEATLIQFNYEVKINPTLRFLNPDGFLLHWSTSGIYWPFTGESNVDRGVHYIRKPVTIAHELAHAHGLTSEGDCNFVAYLACRNSDIPIHQYSAQLSYLGYLMRDALRVKGRDGLSVFYDEMSAEVKQDRKSIFDHHETYTDYFPKLRNKVYDTYLRSQGVKGGITSYNYFVKLKYNWDQFDKL
jgi:hypothetical protein